MCKGRRHSSVSFPHHLKSFGNPKTRNVGKGCHIGELDLVGERRSPPRILHSHQEIGREGAGRAPRGQPARPVSSRAVLTEAKDPALCSQSSLESRQAGPTQAVLMRGVGKAKENRLEGMSHTTDARALFKRRPAGYM